MPAAANRYAGENPRRMNVLSYPFSESCVVDLGTWLHFGFRPNRRLISQVSTSFAHHRSWLLSIFGCQSSFRSSILVAHIHFVMILFVGKVIWSRLYLLVGLLLLHRRHGIWWYIGLILEVWIESIIRALISHWDSGSTFGNVHWDAILKGWFTQTRCHGYSERLIAVLYHDN